MTGVNELAVGQPEHRTAVKEQGRLERLEVERTRQRGPIPHLEHKRVEQVAQEASAWTAELQASLVALQLDPLVEKIRTEGPRRQFVHLSEPLNRLAVPLAVVYGQHVLVQTRPLMEAQAVRL